MGSVEKCDNMIKKERKTMRRRAAAESHYPRHAMLPKGHVFE